MAKKDRSFTIRFSEKEGRALAAKIRGDALPPSPSDQEAITSVGGRIAEALIDAAMADKPKPAGDEWDRIHYPEITDDENQEIRIARRAGFASFFPMFPDATAQSTNTLRAAREFMKAKTGGGA